MSINDSKNMINDSSIPSISCKSFDAFIVDYIDDNLSHEERMLFIKHLRECAPCEKYLDNYQKGIVLGQTAFFEDKENTLTKIPEQLVSAILAARNSA